jgi:hypothetical protein
LCGLHTDKPIPGWASGQEKKDDKYCNFLKLIAEYTGASALVAGKLRWMGKLW